MDSLAVFDNKNYLFVDYLINEKKVNRDFYNVRALYERIDLLKTYKSRFYQKDIIINLISDLIIEELSLTKSRLNLRNHSIEFRLQTPQSELALLITHTDIDRVISIMAIIPHLYNEIFTKDLADEIMTCNSSPDIVPLGRILMKREAKLICVENQYICRTEEDFNQEEFLSYLSATVLSAGRLYPRLHKYLLSVEAADG